MNSAQRGWGEALYQRPPGQYAGAAVPPGTSHHPTHTHVQHHPHHQACHPYDAAAAATVPTVQIQQLMELQAAEETRKNAKRAANRRSASMCRARKTVLVENMAEANERMRRRSRVLSLLPDMILAMRRDGVVTYASENCRHFLQFTREEMEGTNIFDLVESGSHNRLRQLLEENLGSVSKEAIASALRHQGTTFESLLARAEKAKEQGDSSFFSASGEAPRFPGLCSSLRNARRDGGGGCSGSGVGAPDVDGSADDWESEVTSSACESYGRTSSYASSSTGGGRSGSCGGFGGTSEVDSSSNSARGGSGKSSRLYRRPLPPLGPEAFSLGQGKSLMAAAATAATAEGGATGALRGGSLRSVGVASCPSSFDGKKAKEAGAARAFDAISEVSCHSGGGGGGGAKASMVNIDRDLQSKINAFTNNQKDLCKLEMVRQDKKNGWYEVRSSMRLAWLKTKQEIVPVEVVCSFQQMHSDCPAGSANSIVARLQRAVAMGRPPRADGDEGDDISAQNSGLSASGESNCAGGGDLSSEDEHGSESCDSEAASSSSSSSNDYGGGAGCGSLGGKGNGAGNSNNSKREEWKSAGCKPSRKRARGVCTPVPVVSPGRGRPRGGEQPREVERKTAAAGAAADGSGGGREQGGVVVAGESAAPVVAVTSSSTTAKRLAMSAKKTILFRHGFDSLSGAAGGPP